MSRHSFRLIPLIYPHCKAQTNPFRQPMANRWGVTSVWRIDRIWAWLLPVIVISLAASELGDCCNVLKMIVSIAWGHFWDNYTTTSFSNKRFIIPTLLKENTGNGFDHFEFYRRKEPTSQSADFPRSIPVEHNNASKLHVFMWLVVLTMCEVTHTLPEWMRETNS